MTKVKMMFGVIAVVGVVGSALAFKAKACNFCLYQLKTPGVCPLVKTIATFTSSLPNGNQTITPAVDCNCDTTTDAFLCTKTYLGTQVD